MERSSAVINGFESQKPGYVQEPSANGANGENDKRDKHCRWGFMNMVDVIVRVAGLAEERQNQQTKHIERRQCGGDQANGPENPAIVRAMPHLFQDHILAEE